MEQQQDSLSELKQNLIEYVRLQLGDQIIDLELDPAHYQAAYQKTIGTYRQRAQNAYEEAYIFMYLVKDENIYTLPQEVMSVRQIFRRTFGDATGPFASNFDPFAQASLNVYLMNFNVAGGLATYDFYSQYVELASRMFGGYINYTFNPVTKKLQIVRDPRGTGEAVLLWTYQLKPEIQLLSDMQISQWIMDYMVGAAKMIIGEAREKFAAIAGPQGGTSLNGAAMKAEAQAIMDTKVEELKLYVDAGQPLTWVIG
jgi:hypothetical protein